MLKLNLTMTLLIVTGCVAGWGADYTGSKRNARSVKQCLDLTLSLVCARILRLIFLTVLRLFLKQQTALILFPMISVILSVLDSDIRHVHRAAHVCRQVGLRRQNGI